MRQGRRHGLSAEQKADIWRRWKAGESLHEIGRAVDKDNLLFAAQNAVACAMELAKLRPAGKVQ